MDGVSPFRYRPSLMIAGAAFVFGAALAVVTGWVRSELRELLLQREAEALAAVCAMLTEEVANDYAFAGLSRDEAAIAEEVALMAAAVRGVNAVSLHLPDGSLDWGFPVDLSALSPLELSPERQGPRAQYLPAEASELAPNVEVVLPISVQGQEWFLRFAQDGSAARQAFAALDRRLALVAGGAWLLGTAFLASSSAVFSRLLWGRQQLLERRTRELHEAYVDLDLRAKADAVGAIAASLVHDLRGPLNTLSTALRGTSESSPEVAVQAAERMRQITGEIVGILRDQENLRAAPYAWEDLVAILRERFADPRLQFAGSLTEELPGRRGGVVLLILKQLIANALEASPASGLVRVEGIPTPHPTIRVSDSGPGLPKAIREAVFRPATPRLAKGSGVGLAIARQMAGSIGATLSLQATGPEGTTFCLELSPSPHEAYSNDPDPPDHQQLVGSRHN